MIQVYTYFRSPYYYYYYTLASAAPETGVVYNIYLLYIV